MQLADPDRHYFIVECRLEDAAPEQGFMLPSWIPGSYLLREFGRNVVAIEAEGTAGPVAVRQTGKGTWLVAGNGGTLTVRATVYAFDQSVRGAYFDRRRAFFNGTCLFLLPEGHDTAPIELTVERPALESATDQGGGDFSGWQVATAMTPDDIDGHGFGRYRASDYDELIDHPFEIGTHTTIAFEAAGVGHRLAVAGRFEADLDRVATDLARLCAAQIDFFGRPAPFASYSFLGLAVGDGYGGLEHRDSSSLIFRRTDLPKAGVSGVPRDYERFLGLVSHEYFHSWHIKRSKPAAFTPYRLDRRNHTRLLWVFEGITSYYQERFLLTSGLLGAEAFLRRIAELLTRVYRVPGRRHQSLAESSFNAWDHLYKPDADSANRGVSYYGKGALVALALDLRLRRDSESRTSLDDVVRALWQRYGSQGIGLPEDGFEALAREFGGDELIPFFDQAVRGTEDPDLAGAFAEFGLKLAFRQASGPKDPGGTPPASTPVAPTLGAVLENVPGGVRLATVSEGGAAQGAGLAPGDIIAAVDRYRVTMDTIHDRLGRYEEGDVLSVSYFRNDELCNASLVVALPPFDTCYFEMDATAAPAALALRQAWLGC